MFEDLDSWIRHLLRAF
ncbi:hypothetical protein OM302_21790 [Escherichia albertii]|nr:hypothetical protein [Escherichia albertii]